MQNLSFYFCLFIYFIFYEPCWYFVVDAMLKVQVLFISLNESFRKISTTRVCCFSFSSLHLGYTNNKLNSALNLIHLLTFQAREHE